jgi:hypothetical protein
MGIGSDRWYGGFLQTFIGLMLISSKSRRITDGAKTKRNDTRQAQKVTEDFEKNKQARQAPFTKRRQ